MNKEELEQLSDFEINRLICETLPVIIEDNQDVKDIDSAVMVNDIVSMYPLDFCNNWSDMGRLAVKSGISFINDNVFNGACTDYEKHRQADNHNGSGNISAYNESTLRAAAIVWLLMQGDGNE